MPPHVIADKSKLTYPNHFLWADSQNSTTFVSSSYMWNVGQTSPERMLYKYMWLQLWLSMTFHHKRWVHLHTNKNKNCSEWRSIRPTEINQFDITMALHYDITVANAIARDILCDVRVSNGANISQGARWSRDSRLLEWIFTLRSQYWLINNGHVFWSLSYS